jgi:hypothetical protein
MSLTLYNTLTRSKDAFTPRDADNVRMYVCGPTVYDFAHIGNARPIIVFDLLFRVLRHTYGDSHVTYARNITDLDDKINARAAERYPDMDPIAAIKKLTTETTAQFHEDIAKLGVLPPTVELPTEALPQERAVQPRPVTQLRRLPGRSGEESTGEDGPAVLAIDDADDFGDDDDDLLVEDDGLEEAALFVPVPLVEQVDDHTEIRSRPLTAADLPGSAYMLVDKTVELQARPLSEFTELGRLPPDEQQRQALMVFVNPRQAKRLCGRSQRVIKIPDTSVLSRTAPYLLAQGISRVVVEGALFALPGS